LDVLSELDMLDRPQRERHVEYFVEDNRSESGHMQVCNPAPMDGFFDPAVQLGERLGTDDEIGQVSDCLGEQVVKIHARQEGIVLCLRTFRRVCKGDALAVVLEVDRPSGGAR
jgi:predicted deacylase